MKCQKNLQLRAARVVKGFTQAKLAAKLGRSQTWICQIENGLIQASDIDIALICRCLNIAPESAFPNPDQKRSTFQVGRSEKRSRT